MSGNSKAIAALRAQLADLERQLSVLVDVATRLGHLGWTLPMWATPAETKEILLLSDTNEPDAIFQHFYESDNAAHYRSLKSSLLGSSKLTRWHPLIRQCFQAYEQDLFLVVVPAMLTVIEGAIAGDKGTPWWREKDPKQTVKVRLARERDDAMSRAVWASVDAFLSHVFLSHRFDAERPPLLNRPWILHGRDDPDWTRADCLRLFQAADTIGS